MPVLQFKGKTAIECYHHTVPHHVLEFDSKLSLLGKNEKPGLDGNLIIEGDNLLALKALLPTHAGGIKCIYIDPPYNTGDEGWVYNDNLTQPQFKEWIGQTVGKEGEDATRHDKWCCMIYPRLALFDELAKYIFYTETSRDFDRAAINEKTGKIGEHKDTSYYLLYTPDGKNDRALDLDWLTSLHEVEKNRRIVVYCEKIWIHRDDLAKYEAETKRTVRPMLVPFGLR